ncbi:MAG: type II secretion system minor pseudopilin GspK [Gammaproteobacteria bacterium]|nr:type II secretion system minor pseudopilin GspK [Gammaproteobacteria bacterium]
MRLPAAQKGVALITALLIVALAAVISVELSMRLQLDIRRSGNVIASDQALLYLKHAEYYARRTLKEDRLDNNYDSLDEDWAMELPPFPVEGGSVLGRLTDLQGCFNLNSLYYNEQPNALAQQRFNRLMQRLPSPPVTDLSQAIIDWIDANPDTTLPDGAEDSYYLNQERPYRSAGQPLLSLSELRLIKGFTDGEIMQRSESFLCAFGPPADINVNTAPAEVLESLAANISTAMVADIIVQRQTNPSQTMQEFLSDYNLSTVITDTAGLSVSSDYFLLESEARIGQARTLMYSIIHRENNGDTQVIARSQGAY